jgi:phage-related minor tail protein
MKEAGNEAFDAFTDAIISGEKLSDVFKGLQNDLARIAMRALVSKPFENWLGTLGPFQAPARGGGAAAGASAGGGLGGIFSGIGNWFSGLFNAKGNIFQSGNVVPFARGGIIGGPIGFALGNGQLGLAGEAGAEAILPLSRTSGGDLGVKTKGAGITVINNITVEAPTGKLAPRSMEQIQASISMGLQRANMRNT